MKPGGTKYLFDELIYEPAKVYILRHMAETVYCLQCKTDSEKNNIVSATPSRKALMRSIDEARSRSAAGGG